MAKLFSGELGKSVTFLGRLNEAGMTAEEVDRVQEDKDAVLARVMVSALRAHLNPTIIAGASGSTTIELHMDERGTSNYGPPDGWAPKSLEIQHGLMRDIWPKLELPSVEALIAPYTIVGEAPAGYRSSGVPTIVLPDECEGFFIEAKITGLLKLVQGDKGQPDYNRVLKFLVSVLGKRRKNFKDWTEGRLSKEFERAIEEWWKRRLAYEATIPGDFVIYAGQTGIKHRNWSVRASRAYMKHEVTSWVGGTSIDGSQIMLTHEERLTKPEHLAMDCAGSERAPGGDGRFVRASFFDFGGEGLDFYSDGVRRQYPGFGSLGLCLPGAA